MNSLITVLAIFGTWKPNRLIFSSLSADLPDLILILNLPKPLFQIYRKVVKDYSIRLSFFLKKDFNSLSISFFAYTYYI